jgi:hypothetical protein
MRLFDKMSISCETRIRFKWGSSSRSPLRTLKLSRSKYGARFAERAPCLRSQP